MNSKQVADLINTSYKSGVVQQLTKQAALKDIPFIAIRGREFFFTEISDNHGKAYRYKEIQNKVLPKAKIDFIRDELGNFDINKKKHTPEDKLLICTFLKRFNCTTRSVIECLHEINNLKTGKEGSIEVKTMKSLRRKFQKWQVLFKKDGFFGLEDKRGISDKSKNNNKKIDDKLLFRAIAGAGSKGVRKNLYGACDFYYYLVEKENKKKETTKQLEQVSYSGFIKASHKLINSNPQLKTYLKYGWDGLNSDYPVGIKDIGYVNQEWQVDSTKFDFMCLIKEENIENLSSKEKKKRYFFEDKYYRVARANLTAVIDVFSSVAVANLVEIADSYTQVRVLYKAFKKMGKPESVYTDNGLDYISNHYQRALIDFKIKTIQADVGQGRQKGCIERFFGVIQSELAIIPGYIGNSVAKRQEIENQTASKIDIRTSKATRIDLKSLLTLEKLQLLIDKVLSKKYQDYQDFKEFTLTTTTLTNILEKLGKKYDRIVQSEGVRVDNIIYQSHELWSNGLNRGDKVEIYENIDNINEAFIYKNNKLIALAKNKVLGVEAMSAEEHKQAKKDYKANYIKENKKEIKGSQKEYSKRSQAFVKDILGEDAFNKKSQKTVTKQKLKNENNQDFLIDMIKRIG